MIVKVRQIYECGKDSIVVQYSFDHYGLILEMKEIGRHFNLEENEVMMPRIEVTDEFFRKIINNRRLK